jgi:chemotaxis protein methyltransferase CheR
VTAVRGPEEERPADTAVPAPSAPSALPALSPRDFARLSAFIEARYGIHLPPAKRVLLEARLGKRVRELGLSGFGAYCDRVLGGAAADELTLLVDRVTTHKTEFFREPAHFEVLVRRVLPALRPAGAVHPEPLRLWSAGCATGVEPYTLAMVLAEAATADPRLGFELGATDVSPGVVRTAAEGVYSEAIVAPVPLPLRRRWLQRSVADEDVVRVRRALRERIRFRALNLLDADYGIPHPMDVIFCRNVLIYFDRALQLAVVERLAQVLAPGGFLFLGHSETLQGTPLPLEPVAPTVYRRAAAGRHRGRP